MSAESSTVSEEDITESELEYPYCCPMCSSVNCDFYMCHTCGTHMQYSDEDIDHDATISIGYSGPSIEANNFVSLVEIVGTNGSKDIIGWTGSTGCTGYGGSSNSVTSTNSSNSSFIIGATGLTGYN